MGAIGSPRHADEHGARLRIPVRGAHADQRRHEVDTLGVRYLASERLDLLRVLYEAQPVTQPVDGRAGDEDGALEGIVGLAANAPGDGGQKAALRQLGRLAYVHQHEAAGAVGVLGHAGLEAALPEEGGLLVAGDAADGRLDAEERLRVGVPEEVARLTYLGEGKAVGAEQADELVVPGAGVDVEEERAARVREVGGVHLAAGEAVQEP